MQRQSLGSPSSNSKLVKDEQQLPSPSSSFTLNAGEDQCEEGEELKKLTKHRTAMPQSYIHFIPILTLLCFLILYLSSHDPSRLDMAEFNGFNTLQNIGATESNIENISELQRMLAIDKGDIMAIRSLKNLKQDADAAKHRRLHRKIAHF